MLTPAALHQKGICNSSVCKNTKPHFDLRQKGPNRNRIWAQILACCSAIGGVNTVFCPLKTWGFKSQFDVPLQENIAQFGGTCWLEGTGEVDGRKIRVLSTSPTQSAALAGQRGDKASFTPIPPEHLIIQSKYLFNSYGKEVVPLGKALPAGLICVIKTASATLELQWNFTFVLVKKAHSTKDPSCLLEDLNVYFKATFRLVSSHLSLGSIKPRWKQTIIVSRGWSVSQYLQPVGVGWGRSHQGEEMNLAACVSGGAASLAWLRFGSQEAPKNKHTRSCCVPRLAQEKSSWRARPSWRRGNSFSVAQGFCGDFFPRM